MIDKPQLTLFSRFRHKCLGLTHQRSHSMNNTVFACLAWLYSQARNSEGGIIPLSNLLDHAWDKTNPSNTNEVLALGVLCGSLYDRMDDQCVNSALRALAAETQLVVGTTATFDVFYVEIIAQLDAEDASPEGQAYLLNAEKDSVEEQLLAHY